MEEGDWEVHPFGKITRSERGVVLAIFGGGMYALLCAHMSNVTAPVFIVLCILN